MTSLRLFYILSLGLLTACSSFGFPRKPAPLSSKWELVWSDEFTTDGAPDPQKWTFETGGGGWGNHDKQFYTSRIQNARVENGHLVIEAHREKYQDHDFTSGRVRSLGKGWKYGRIEVRAKLPSGAGTWPAIWMMPSQMTFGTELWPDNGEIDIMEHVGREPTQILSCFYSKNFNWMHGNGILQWTSVPDAESAFHIYSFDWNEDEISVAIDGKTHLISKNPRTSWQDWPFTHEFYLIMNLAMGGFGGDVDDSIQSRQMLIDYVRVYQR